LIAWQQAGMWQGAKKVAGSDARAVACQS
jgi:hypothetical protein